MDGDVLSMLFIKNKRRMSKLKLDFENCCVEYVDKFILKHKFGDYSWFNDEIGSFVTINAGGESILVAFDEIRYDIDNNILKEDFAKYYRYYCDNQRCISYQEYLKGTR